MERMIQEKLETISLYDFDGCSIDVAIKILQKLKDRHTGKDIYLDLQTCDYSDDKQYAVIWKRPETEVEKNDRLKEEEKNKAYRRAEYQRLKKEFGDE